MGRTCALATELTPCAARYGRYLCEIKRRVCCPYPHPCLYCEPVCLQDTLKALTPGPMYTVQVLLTGSLLLVGDMLQELHRRQLWKPFYEA